jgi:hypothetical protein
MKKFMSIKSVSKYSLIITSIILLSGTSIAPVAVYADDSSSSCVAPTSSQPGVHVPMGADAKTYTYNCTTGLWQNSYYTYNPSTGATTPSYPIVYTYNQTTGLYDYTIYTYDAPQSDYVTVVESIAQPPAGATIQGGPIVVVTPVSGGQGGSVTPAISPSGTSDGTSSDPNAVGSNGINTTGPDSTNALSSTNNNNVTLNNGNASSINNVLNQGATTGDATELANTVTGNATSGNSQNIANVLNLLQSSSNALGSGTQTFVANINGNVNGNLLIDPSALSNIQPASTTTSTNTNNNNLTVNNSNSNAINNNLNLDSASGNASETDNTVAGNATSGSATAIANVVNLIDSAISSGNSFIGVININGNFNGNIEVPASLYNQLLASNVPTVTINTTGAGSNNQANTTNNNTTNINNTNNEGINNNVNATAASGNATASSNTASGNTTSGNANTNVTAFNLTGSNVIGANDLLVFVNVLGNWVGMIVNAPAGATAAEIGGGITSDTTNNNTTVNNTNNDSINNNINAKANSGNASETGNTKAGDTTSGNADTAVNLLNAEGTNLSLSGWFGILFINVFGTWTGNFGVEPSPADSIPSGGTGTSSTSAKSGSVPASIKAFRFEATNPNDTTTATETGSDSQSTDGSVLAAHISQAQPSSSKNADYSAPSKFDELIFPAIAVAAFVLYILGDRVFAARRASKTTNLR